MDVMRGDFSLPKRASDSKLKVPIASPLKSMEKIGLSTPRMYSPVNGECTPPAASSMDQLNGHQRRLMTATGTGGVLASPTVSALKKTTGRPISPLKETTRKEISRDVSPRSPVRRPLSPQRHTSERLSSPLRKTVSGKQAVRRPLTQETTATANNNNSRNTTTYCDNTVRLPVITTPAAPAAAADSKQKAAKEPSQVTFSPVREARQQILHTSSLVIAPQISPLKLTTSKSHKYLARGGLDLTAISPSGRVSPLRQHLLENDCEQSLSYQTPRVDGEVEMEWDHLTKSFVQSPRKAL